MKMKLIVFLMIFSLLLSACVSNIKPETFGAGTVGAIGAGAACAAAVDGKYKVLAALGCGIFGGATSIFVSKLWDEKDKIEAEKFLETSSDGEEMGWKNPDTKHQFKMTQLKTFNNQAGEKCRQFQLVVNGKSPTKSHACRKKHGRWKFSEV